MTKYIDRLETIQRFKREHEKLKKLISSLPKEYLRQKMLGEWAIKDVVAHLAAWNWEIIDEVDRVLRNKATWPAQEDRVWEDEFNRKEVEKRKGKSWKGVLKEWDDSFWAQIEKMERISDEEWNHQSGNQFRSNGTPVSASSLFVYEYRGEGHEGGHAKQIEQFAKDKK